MGTPWPQLALFPRPSAPHLATPTTEKESKNASRVSIVPHLEITEEDRRRFYSHVVVTDQCWIWVGGIYTPDGYGRYTWQRGGEQCTMSAHRFSLVACGETIPPGMVAEHQCNEPLCVRPGPGHVVVSTQSENLSYAVRTGRHIGKFPGAGQDRVARSRRVRKALRGGWNEKAYAEACMGNAPTLF